MKKKKKKSTKKGKVKVDEELRIKKSPMKRKDTILQKDESSSEGKCFYYNKRRTLEEKLSKFS